MRSATAPTTEAGAAVRTLETVCRSDLRRLCGVAGSPLGQLALDLLLGGRVRRFAEALAAFDADVAAQGVAVAARALCARYGGSVVADGIEHVPASGPVLLVANHPGLMDAMAVYATFPRPDIRALARPQPLLGLIPALAPHLLMLPDEGAGRAGGLREVLRTLRAGGALLLFPAGHLEPEPALLGRHRRAGGAPVEPLGAWSTGVGTLVRLAARQDVPLQVIPTAIAGALSTETWRWFGPLLRRRRTVRGREDLTAVLQLAFPRLGRTTVRVSYGTPLDAAALASAGPDGEAIATRLRAAILHDLRRNGSG